jgi:hypothetical protein
VRLVKVIIIRFWELQAFCLLYQKWNCTEDRDSIPNVAWEVLLDNKFNKNYDESEKLFTLHRKFFPFDEEKPQNCLFWSV